MERFVVSLLGAPPDSDWDIMPMAFDSQERAFRYALGIVISTKDASGLSFKICSGSGAKEYSFDHIIAVFKLSICEE